MAGLVGALVVGLRHRRPEHPECWNTQPIMFRDNGFRIWVMSRPVDDTERFDRPRWPRAAVAGRADATGNCETLCIPTHDDYLRPTISFDIETHATMQTGHGNSRGGGDLQRSSGRGREAATRRWAPRYAPARTVRTLNRPPRIAAEGARGNLVRRHDAYVAT